MPQTQDKHALIARVQNFLSDFGTETEKRNKPVHYILKANSETTSISTNDCNQQFDADFMRRAKVIDATSAGTVVLELEIGDEYSNAGGK